VLYWKRILTGFLLFINEEGLCFIDNDKVHVHVGN
jgi:hypothetical protein